MYSLRFYCLKEIFKAKIKQEDFDEINALKQNMQFMDLEEY